MISYMKKMKGEIDPISNIDLILKFQQASFSFMSILANSHSFIFVSNSLFSFIFCLYHKKVNGEYRNKAKCS
jgi:hypothetical protein